MTPMRDVLGHFGSLFSELSRRRILHVAVVYWVVAWVVMEVSSVVVPALTLPPWTLTLVVVLAALGFPVAMVLAWAFDVTPRGVERARGAGADAGPEAGFEVGPVLRTVLVVLVLAVSAVAGWASWELWLGPEARRMGVAAAGGRAEGSGSEAREAYPPTRVAVLYFDDHSPGRELEHVAAGFTEALLHELSAVEALDVVSRNGVKAYRDAEVPVDSIVRALRVGTLIEGSIERSGERLVVTAQLVDAASGTHIVSERVEGRGDDVLEIRDALVERVGRALLRELGEEIRVGTLRAETESAEAWRLYHRAEELAREADELRYGGDTATVRRLYAGADSLLGVAEEADPDWVAPPVTRGWIQERAARVGRGSVMALDAERLRAGIRLADEALAREPGNAKALELRGSLRYYLSRVLGGPEAEELVDAAEEDLRGAVTEDPERARAWAVLADLLRSTGRLAEARVAVERGFAADAYLSNDRDLHFLLAHLALELENFREAEELAGKVAELYPGDPRVSALELIILASSGDTRAEADTAWRLVRAVEAKLFPSGWPQGDLQVAPILARAGMGDSARAVIRRARAGAPESPFTDYYEAYARLVLGEEAKALRLLESYLSARPERRSYTAQEWWWRPLRDEPAFRALVSEGGSPTRRP